MIDYIEQIGNIRESIPINGEYYLLSQLEINDIKINEVIVVAAEFQAVNEGLKKGDYAIFITSIIKTSREQEVLFRKEDSECEITLIENLGDNIINKKDHYQQVCRIRGRKFKKDYTKLFVNLWVKSGSTQASKGDVCHFKPNTSLMIWRMS